jgi:hypothetical protein
VWLLAVVQVFCAFHVHQILLLMIMAVLGIISLIVIAPVAIHRYLPKQWGSWLIRKPMHHRVFINRDAAGQEQVLQQQQQQPAAGAAAQQPAADANTASQDTNTAEQPTQQMVAGGDAPAQDLTGMIAEQQEPGVLQLTPGDLAGSSDAQQGDAGATDQQSADGAADQQVDGAADQQAQTQQDDQQGTATDANDQTLAEEPEEEEQQQATPQLM